MAPHNVHAHPQGLDAVRNIGILAHVDAGKTSITEKILQLAGVIREAGTVDTGTTSTDYLSVERAHGITVKSAAVRFAWKNHDIHLIDTPGHVDFGNEVDRALRILDGAIIALCAVSGVQARTETISRACKARDLPRIYFVNKMDRTGADFAAVVENLRLNLEPGAVPIQWPRFSGNTWKGSWNLYELPASDTDLPPAAFEARDVLLERLAECDDAIMDYFMKNEIPPADVIAPSIARAVASGAVAPVLCGSAFEDSSIATLLDAVVDFLPSPAARKRPQGKDPRTGQSVSFDPHPEAPLSAFVFKTRKEGSSDLYAWTRVWSGTIRAGSKVYDARSGKDALVRNVFGIHAEELIDLGSGEAGDVVALKVSSIEAGASLCSKTHPVVFEALEIPRPVIRLVLESNTNEEKAPLRQALESMSIEDSSLVVREEKETGRFEIAGQGELHLAIVVERLKKDFHLKVRTGNPKVNLKEKLRHQARAREDFDRDFGGERVRVTLALELVPIPEDERKTEQDQGFAELTVDAGVKIPPNFLEALKRGIRSALFAGPAEGWPLEPVAVRLTEFTPPASSTGKNGELACEVAAAFATRNAAAATGSIVLEPVMRIDIECPEAYFGAVLGAVSARSGRIESVEDRLSVKAISAAAPMSSLFGFATELRSLSQGRAEFQARFLDYEPLSAHSRASS